MQQNVFHQTKHYSQLLKAIRSDYVIKRDHSFYIISHYLGRSVRSKQCIRFGYIFHANPEKPISYIGKYRECLQTYEPPCSQSFYAKFSPRSGRLHFQLFHFIFSYCLLNLNWKTFGVCLHLRLWWINVIQSFRDLMNRIYLIWTRFWICLCRRYYLGFSLWLY